MEVSISHYQKALKQGKLLVYPTETLWGLGADITKEEAVNSVYKLIKRSKSEPVSVLVKDIQMAKKFCMINSQVEKALHILWPGPVTFILPMLPDVGLKHLSDKEGFMSMRCSPHPFVRTLLWDYPNPITTSSVVRKGDKPSPSLSSLNWLPEDIEKVDWPDLAASKGSTILKINETKFTMIREGDIKAPFIKRILVNLCSLTEES